MKHISEKHNGFYGFQEERWSTFRESITVSMDWSTFRCWTRNIQTWLQSKIHFFGSNTSHAFIVYACVITVCNKREQHNKETGSAKMRFINIPNLYRSLNTRKIHILSSYVNSLFSMWRTCWEKKKPRCINKCISDFSLLVPTRYWVKTSPCQMCTGTAWCTFSPLPALGWSECTERACRIHRWRERRLRIWCSMALWGWS